MLIIITRSAEMDILAAHIPKIHIFEIWNVKKSVSKCLDSRCTNVVAPEPQHKKIRTVFNKKLKWYLAFKL